VDRLSPEEERRRVWRMMHNAWWDNRWKTKCPATAIEIDRAGVLYYEDEDGSLVNVDKARKKGKLPKL
jgi:hypothetical protein